MWIKLLVSSKYQLIESIRIQNQKNEIHVNGDDVIKSVKMTEKRPKTSLKPANIFRRCRQNIRHLGESVILLLP